METRFNKLFTLLATVLVAGLYTRWPLSRYIGIFSPLLVLLAVYNYFLLLTPGKTVPDFLFSGKTVIGLLTLSVFSVVTCYPTIQIIDLRNHPFQDYDLFWLALMLLLLLAVLNYTLLSPGAWWTRIVRACTSAWRMPEGYFLLLCAGWVFVVANILSLTVFEHIPHVQDEIAQFMQAKIFARGSLTAPLPPIPEFFQYYYDNMIFTDRWYSQYTPGHPFFLIIGVLCGAPWIINPLLAAFSVILLYKYAALVYAEKEARLATILFCVSPFVLFMSASFMNHVSALFTLLVFLYAGEKALLKQSAGYAVLAGAALGMLINIRTGNAAVFGALFSTYLLVRSVRTRTFRLLGCFAGAVLVMAGILLLYNYATNGNPLLFGYQVRWGEEHTLGFHGKSIIDRPAFTPLEGLTHTITNFMVMNQNLFEWPFPSLLPLMIFFLPFIFKKTGKDYLLLCGFLAIPVLHFFYFFQDLCLGPRFFYATVPFAVILTARALFVLAGKIASIKGLPERRVKQAFIAVLMLSVIYAGWVKVPQLYAHYAASFWEVDDRLMKKAGELGITNALIFQQSYGYKGNSLGAGFLHNSPALDGPVVFARDLGARNAELLPFFPGRTYYRAFRDVNGAVVIEPLLLLKKKDTHATGESGYDGQ